MNLAIKGSAVIKLIRPWNFLITFFSIIVAVLISTDSKSLLQSPELIEIMLMAALSGSLTASAGYIINDYFDIRIDLVNRPQRPLPGGLLKLNEALALYFVLFFAGLLVSAAVNVLTFLLVLIASNLLFLYSYKMKRIILVGNLLVAFLTGLSFIYGGAAVNNMKPALFPALLAFLINLIRELLKDIEDLEGDKKEGVITFPGKYGISNSKKLIFLITMVLVVLTLTPFFFNYYKIEFTVIAAVVINPLLIYFLKSLNENHSPENLHKLSNILKLEMVFGLAAIYLGI